MKLIIAGSRQFNFDLGTIHNILDALMLEDLGLPDEIVSGACRGIDRSGSNWAEFQNIPVKYFKADWDTYGKAAGPIRNKEMAEYADALLLIWDMESRGSKNMRENMLRLGKPIYECMIRKVK